MGRLDHGNAVLRRMQEKDIEAVKMLIKEGCEGTENRLILHLLTRPLALLMLATLSSILRCVLHSFIMALVIPVFILIVYLKLTIPRSVGILGSSRPYWDYVGSSYHADTEPELPNPHSDKVKLIDNQKKTRRAQKNKEKEKPNEREQVDEDELKERARVAGEVWVADCDGEIIGCVARDGWSRMVYVGSAGWWSKLVPQRGTGQIAGAGFGIQSKAEWNMPGLCPCGLSFQTGRGFFRRLGYRLQGETPGIEEKEEDEYEEPDKGWLGFPLTKVFVKDL